MKKQQLINNFLTYFDGVEPISKMSTYQLGLCDLQVLDDNNLKVILRRPGLLIGKGGEDIAKLEKYLGCKIIIEEKRF